MAICCAAPLLLVAGLVAELQDLRLAIIAVPAAAIAFVAVAMFAVDEKAGAARRKVVLAVALIPIVACLWFVPRAVRAYSAFHSLSDEVLARDEFALKTARDIRAQQGPFRRAHGVYASAAELVIRGGVAVSDDAQPSATTWSMRVRSSRCDRCAELLIDQTGAIRMRRGATVSRNDPPATKQTLDAMENGEAMRPADL